MSYQMKTVLLALSLTLSACAPTPATAAYSCYAWTICRSGHTAHCTVFGPCQVDYVPGVQAVCHGRDYHGEPVSLISHCSMYSTMPVEAAADFGDGGTGELTDEIGND